jgi:hypothetical protein
VKHTVWITGRADDGPYADQLTAEGSRAQALDAITDTLLPGEQVRSVREGSGGTDITLRGGPS